MKKRNKRNTCLHREVYTGDYAVTTNKYELSCPGS